MDRTDGGGTARRRGRRIRYTDGALTWVGDPQWAQAAPRLDALEAFRGPRLLRLDDTPSFVDSIAAPERYIERCSTLSGGRYRQGFWEEERDLWLSKVRNSVGEDGRMAFGCPAEFVFDVFDSGGSWLATVRMPPGPM